MLFLCDFFLSQWHFNMTLSMKKISEISAIQPFSFQKLGGGGGNSLGRLLCIKYQLSVTVIIASFPAHY